ncbi:MAG TPA: hypothetical protein P5568_07395 [Acidobacteriota bacterium]|nr:hypothetical protein [Acidobacteriota bacterium]HRV08280.1 hypothetical protein [Acidobacteriota bacterium]
MSRLGLESYRVDDELMLPRFPEPDERRTKILEALQANYPVRRRL